LKKLLMLPNKLKKPLKFKMPKKKSLKMLMLKPLKIYLTPSKKKKKLYKKNLNN